MSDEDPTRPVNIDPALVMCPWHGEPFRGAWPQGFLPFAIKLVEFGFAHLPEDARPSAIMSDQAKHQVLEAALRRHAPICCWLPEEKRLEAYTFADHDFYQEMLEDSWAKDGVCDLCGNPGRGTRFQVVFKPGSPAQQLDHVCLSCVAAKVYSANAPRGRRAA